MPNSEKRKGSSLNKQKKCLHCKTKFSGKGDFCCHGCKTAYGIINKLGMKKFYHYLEQQISRKELNLQNKAFPEKIDVTEFISKTDDNKNELNIFVEDLHCSSCVWLIEEALKKQPNVEYARLNMSTRRMVIRWNGKKNLGNEYLNLIIKMGYRPSPFDPETATNKEQNEQKDLLLAMGVAGFASGNIMLLSVALWSTSQEIMGVATRDFIHLVAAMIAIPTVIFSGRIFFKSAFKAVSNARSNMDVPISIAIILTTLISIWEGFNSAEHTYFDSVTMLVFFLLIGRYLDIRSRNKARSAATEMLRLTNNSALLVTNSGKIKTVPAAKIKKGDIMLVNAGDKVPVDGVIIEGETQIDTSIITGESLPKDHKKGDEIFAGTINLSVPIKIKASKASKKSLISEVIKLMEKAETGSKYSIIAQKAVSIYAPLVYFAGIITFSYWYFYGEIDFKQALLISISVLIITCPCAFGLAVPAVQIIAGGRLFKDGIMLKNGNALEILAEVSHVVFDKTGTLTKGKPQLTNKQNIKKNDLKMAASIAAQSNHPYSKAITNSYNGTVYDIEVKENPGKGLEAKYQGDKYRLGKASWAGTTKDGDLILTKNGNKLSGFKFSDRLREGAKNTIEELKDQHLSISLISGDNEKQVNKIAKSLNIKDVIPACLPNQKIKEIDKIKNAGKTVLMVGDGLNDAPAMASANVSISPASGMYITQNSADIVFNGEKLNAIVKTLNIAKKATSIIKQNFSIAFIYNIVAIPIAFLGYVTPLIAAIAMSFSSILVILNSFRLARN